MNNIRLRTGSLIFACLLAAQFAWSQAGTNGLSVNAEAALLSETNSPKVFLTIHLVNTSDHEITVLTKNLDVQLEGSANQERIFVLGLSSPAVTHDGHNIVPSLYDFSPVTLKPNEEAFISREISGTHFPLMVTADTRLIVRYVISPAWAKRFALWSGSAESKPFTAKTRKPR